MRPIVRPIVSPQYARKQKHRQIARDHAERPKRNKAHTEARKQKLLYLRRVEHEHQREIDAACET